MSGSFYVCLIPAQARIWESAISACRIEHRVVQAYLSSTPCRTKLLSHNCSISNNTWHAVIIVTDPPHALSFEAT